MILVKYHNRRLYSKELSEYVSYNEVIEVIRKGEEITVTCHKTGKDLTKEVLLGALASLGAERLDETTLKSLIIDGAIS